ncbi:MAG: hypothetical protein AAB542_02815 [Patescibacteria group bacterium]
MPKKIAAKKRSVPVPPPFDSVAPQVTTRKGFSWRWVLIGLAVLFVILLAANKGLVLAAIVNGKPIFTWQLNTTMRTRYGQQTLEGMIGESLIASEAKKSGLAITNTDIQVKQKEILSSLGTEVNLEDFLKFQGLTEADFNQQLKVQLTVEKLLTRGLTITEADIDNYIATNRALLTATEPASLREEAKKAIIGNTVSEKLQSWFLELRQKSNVMKFL